MKTKKLFTPPSVLRIARVSAGLSQTQLSSAINRSTAFISRVENGSGPARLTSEIAERIGAAVGVAPETLFEGGKR